MLLGWIKLVKHGWLTCWDTRRGVFLQPHLCVSLRTFLIMWYRSPFHLPTFTSLPFQPNQNYSPLILIFYSGPKPEEIKMVPEDCRDKMTLQPFHAKERDTKLLFLLLCDHNALDLVGNYGFKASVSIKNGGLAAQKLPHVVGRLLW